jgi:ketosteroid isomerase-like protein
MTLERLLLEADCRALVAETTRCVDAAQPDALALLFTADAVLLRPGAAPLVGRAAIRAAYAERPPNRLTRHLVTHTRITVVDADTVDAASLLLVWSGSSDDAPGPRGRPGQQAVGEFDDRLVRTPEGWRIARREARFVLHAPGG